MENTELKIFTFVNRPPKKLIDGFAEIPVADIADNVSSRSCMDISIHSINNMNLLGPAITVKLRSSDNLLLHKALDIAQPGDVIVVDTRGDLVHPVFGKMMAMWAQQKSIGGIVIDGVVRDIGALKKIGIPVYAAGFVLNRFYKEGSGEINVAVNCGGVEVNPGDILVGDEDGIVVITPQDAEDILAKSQAKLFREQQIVKDIERMAWNREWIDKALEARKAIIVNDHRIFPRVNVDAPVTIITESNQPISATAMNISLEGMLVQAEQPLELDTLVRICLSKELGNIDIMANVIWRQYDNFGCKFVDMSESMQATLDYVIYRQLQISEIGEYGY